MVKLARPCLSSVNEAKQVWKLYHVCTLEDLVEYIMPSDSISGSGKYKNWLLNGNTDVVSFTRDKNFVVKTSKLRRSPVIFNFEMDGDKLSHKYKIFPYNDLAFHSDTGVFDPNGYDETALEHEEVVVGTIHNFSSYITSARFCVFLDSFGIISNLVEDLNIENTLYYFEDIPTTYDSKLKPYRSFLRNMVQFPTYKDFVDSVLNLYKISRSSDPLKLDPSEIKDAFKFFKEDQLFSILNYSYGNRIAEKLKQLILS